MKKCISLICVFLLLIGCAACSDSGKDKKQNADVVRNEEDINLKYDEIVKEYENSKPLDPNTSVLGEDFSAVDFTFTSVNDVMAYTIYDNSFVKLVKDNFYFDAIAASSNKLILDSITYKTARNIAPGNTANEFMQSYNISDDNALYKKVGSATTDGSHQVVQTEESEYYYKPTNGYFTGKLTVLYGSADAVSYSILPADVVQEFISVRDINANGDYMDPQKIMDEFSNYKSLVSLDITTDETGVITEIAVYKFNAE